MAMAEKIKILLIKKDTTLKELAEKINNTPSNLSNKLRRDNFPESELEEIAKALEVKYFCGFEMPETGEVIK